MKATPSESEHKFTSHDVGFVACCRWQLLMELMMMMVVVVVEVVMM